jgi:hypothetical protein
MKIWPHSVHSFRAVNSLLMVAVFISTQGLSVLLASFISVIAATALAITMGLESLNNSFKLSRKSVCRNHIK